MLKRSGIISPQVDNNNNRKSKRKKLTTQTTPPSPRRHEAVKLHILQILESGTKAALHRLGAPEHDGKCLAAAPIKELLGVWI